MSVPTKSALIESINVALQGFKLNGPDWTICLRQNDQDNCHAFIRHRNGEESFLFGGKPADTLLSVMEFIQGKEEKTN